MQCGRPTLAEAIDAIDVDGSDLFGLGEELPRLRGGKAQFLWSQYKATAVGNETRKTVSGMALELMKNSRAMGNPVQKPRKNFRIAGFSRT